MCVSEENQVSEIRAVIFDWGGVIIENPVDGLLEYARKHIEGITSEIFDSDAMIAFQKGEICESDFWENVGFQGASDGESFKGSLWRSGFESTYTEKKIVVDLAYSLQRAGITTAMLSNTEKPAVEMLMDMGYTCFDQSYFSCDWGMVKPHIDIYERAIDALNVPSETILFIDDKVENIEAAQSVGMKGHVMKGYTGLDRRLKELGLPGLY